MQQSERQQIEKQLEARGSLLKAPANPPKWIKSGKEPGK